MFNSADSALRWAAEVRSTELYKASSINRMCGKPRRPTQNDILIGLSPDETYKQAVNIFAIVKGLQENNPVSESYLMAKFFYEDDITRVLSRVLMSMSDRSIDITILVKAYFGTHRVTHRMMRDSLYCRNSQVKHYQKMVYDIMDKIHYQAMDQIENKMVDAGLVIGSKDMAYG